MQATNGTGTYFCGGPYAGVCLTKTQPQLYLNNEVASLTFQERAWPSRSEGCVCKMFSNVGVSSISKSLDIS